MIRKGIGTEVRQSNLKIKGYLPIIFFDLFFIDSFNVFSSLYLEQDVVVVWCAHSGRGSSVNPGHRTLTDLYQMHGIPNICQCNVGAFLVRIYIYMQKKIFSISLARVLTLHLLLHIPRSLFYKKKVNQKIWHLRLEWRLWKMIVHIFIMEGLNMASIEIIFIF